MTQSVVQVSTHQSFFNSTSLNSSISLTGVTSGNDIAVMVVADDFGGGSNTRVSSVNDGNAYRNLGFKQFDTSNRGSCEHWLLHNVSSGSHSIAVTLSESCYGFAVALEISGNAASPLDVTQTNSGSSKNPATGTSASTAQANELVLVSFGGNGSMAGGSDPPNTGYTDSYTNLGGGGVMPSSQAYKIVSATGTQSADLGTITTSTAWGVLLTTLKAAVAAPTSIGVIRRKRLIIPRYTFR